jgi:hypothetical protein
LADEQASFAAKEEARRRLAGLNQTEGNDRQAVVNSTRGPMEQWSADFADIGEELEDLKVRGIMGAVDALTQLTNGWDSFADAAKNAISQVLMELIRLQLMKMAVSLIGGASGAPIGATGDFLGAGALSFAGGGAFNIKGRPGIDNNLLSINGLPVANVSYGERISVSNDNGGGGMIPPFVFNNYARMSAKEARETGLQAAHAFKRALGRSAKASG